MNKIMVIVATASMAIAATVGAKVITGRWTDATTNEDGSAIPATGAGSIASTRFEWGTCNGSAFGNKLGEVTVQAGSPRVAPTSDLPPGTYCGRFIHKNTYGVESDPSDVVTKTIDAPKPGKPQNPSWG